MNIILTGATGRVGYHTAKLLLQDNNKLVIHAKNKQKILALINQLNQPERVFPICSDLSVPKAAQLLIEEAVAYVGYLDVLINNAACFHFGTLLELSATTLSTIIQTNLTAPILLTRFALPYLIKTKGMIINISSIAGQHYLPGAATYCASKHGLVGFGGSIAEEVKSLGVRVCTINPGQLTLTSTAQTHTIPPDELAQLINHVIHYPVGNSFPNSITLSAS